MGSTFGAEPACAFNNGIPQFDHFLDCRYAGAVVCGDFFKAVFPHAFYDPFLCRFEWPEGRNVKTAIDPIHILTALDLLLCIVGRDLNCKGFVNPKLLKTAMG